jgi:hypothetical protein
MSKGFRELKGILQMLIDFAFFCLMILGLGGAMLKLLMPHGWLETWMHELGRYEPGALLTGGVFTAVAFLVVKVWLERFKAKTWLGDLIMYAWVALGLYFVVKLVVAGTW